MSLAALSIRLFVFLAQPGSAFIITLLLFLRCFFFFVEYVHIHFVQTSCNECCSYEVSYVVQESVCRVDCRPDCCEDRYYRERHSDCLEDAEAVANLIESKFPNMDGKVSINYVGNLIGSHTGPGTVALYFWGKDLRTEDL